jgi:hypothetical protein
MRSRDSICNDILQKFRESVKTGRAVKVSKTIDKDFIKKTFLIESPEDCVILAWTNKRVNYWNNFIRENIFKDLIRDTILKKYYEGEILIFSGYRSSLNHTYHSNDQIKIVKVEIKDLEVPYVSCIHNEKLNKIESCKDCNIKGHTKKTKKIKFYILLDEFNNKWFKPYDDKDASQINKMKTEYKQKALNLKKKPYWEEFYGFKEHYDPDLKYSYSLTCHKSQGSQYKKVFVDISNIRLCKDLPLSLRLSYTAISRMIDVAYFI